MNLNQHHIFNPNYPSYNSSSESTANLTNMLCQQNDQNQKIYHKQSNRFQRDNTSQCNKQDYSISELNKIRDQHHHQVRIRYMEQIKLKKRKQQLTNKLIEEILSIQLPKQSTQCKDWSEDVISLLGSQNSYVFKAYELLQIFRLAQKFPNISTLRLFRIAINKTSQNHVKQLMNEDIFKFFHNLLQFPGIKNIQNKINPETVWQNHAISYYTQPLNLIQQNQKSQKQENQNIQAYFIQLDTVKNVILALGQLYQKSPQMRKFSIQIHHTYDKVLAAFRTYKEDIKTQFIEYLLMTTQREIYTNYNQNYIKIVKMTCELAMFYKYRFNFQMVSQKEEDQMVIQGTQFRRDSNVASQKHQEFLAQKLKRSGMLIKTLRIFITNKESFMKSILQSQNTKHNFLDLIITYLKYGKLILNITHHLNQEQYLNFTTFVKQSLQFFFYFDEKMLPNEYSTGNIDGYRQIIQILTVIRQKHQLLDKKSKNSQIQTLKNQNYNQNYHNFEDIRRGCYFSLSNGIHSVVQCMPNQFKNILFFTKPLNNPSYFPKQFNLIEEIDYWLYAQLSMINQHQLIYLTLSVLKFSYIQEVKDQIRRFNLIQKLLQKSGDSLIKTSDRIFILNQLSQFIERMNKQFSCENRVYFLQIIYTNCQQRYENQTKLDIYKQKQNLVYPFLQALLGQAQMQLNKYS